MASITSSDILKMALKGLLLKTLSADDSELYTTQTSILTKQSFKYHFPDSYQGIALNDTLLKTLTEMAFNHCLLKTLMAKWQRNGCKRDTTQISKSNCDSASGKPL